MLSQLAKRCGVTVIGTVGSDAKAETASLYGADHVVNYERCADWSAKVLLDLTGGSGVDVVFDGVGAKTAQGSILATHRLGQVVFFGSSSGQPRVSFPDLRTKSLRVSAFELFHMLERKQEWNRAITELASLVKRGLLEPFVTETYSWNEAAVAHKRIEARATRGKTALIHG
ncbi:MAG TPA: zinc-binding dehydrogenase [Gemmatimonadales bacterium]|nr:zinc-binding dehydrogenase [Gemmatimonadales bacterium]